MKTDLRVAAEGDRPRDGRETDHFMEGHGWCLSAMPHQAAGPRVSSDMQNPRNNYFLFFENRLNSDLNLILLNYFNLYIRSTVYFIQITYCQYYLFVKKMLSEQNGSAVRTPMGAMWYPQPPQMPDRCPSPPYFCTF